jgi:hypothetical protein
MKEMRSRQDTAATAFHFPKSVHNKPPISSNGDQMSASLSALTRLQSPLGKPTAQS